MLAISETNACDLSELGSQNLFHVGASLEFAEGRNTLLKTTDGAEYIDFLSGCGSLNYGHNDPDMRDALMKYIARNEIAHSLDMATKSKNQFVSTFVDYILAPQDMDFKIQFTGPTGTNAVEAALKLARKITGRSSVVAITNGFHGVSLGALAATGNGYNRRAAGIASTGVARFPYDGYLGPQIDTIDLLERMLADPSSGVDLARGLSCRNRSRRGRIERGEAALVEPAQAARQPLFDAVDHRRQPGRLRRTGTFFSSRALGVVTDIVVLAKSLSGFGLPLAAVLIRRELDVWRPGEHNGTFRGNNHALLTATTAIRKYSADNSFVARSASQRRPSKPLWRRSVPRPDGSRKDADCFADCARLPSRSPRRSRRRRSATA